MGLTTHHMSGMDPQKTDIQQIQSIILIEEAKNFLKIAMLSLLAMGQFMVVLGVFQMKQISKWVKLHITCPVCTDEFQQIQLIGSMEEAKKCL